MLPRCDLDEQVTATSRHGQGVRPDVVVRLPGEKVLVIDAKAPMSAFLDAQAEDLGDDERAALLGQHAAGLRRHIEALAAKDYWSAFTASPEFVVCFVPSDAMWQQDSVATSASELLDVGSELYRRLATLGGHTAKLGRSLTSSVEAYNAMVGALESRVLVTARRMQHLGLSTDELPSLAPVDTGPRPLTAQELIDAATQQDARAQLLFDIRNPESGDAQAHTG